MTIRCQNLLVNPLERPSLSAERQREWIPQETERQTDLLCWVFSILFLAFYMPKKVLKGVVESFDCAYTAQIQHMAN